MPDRKRQKGSCYVVGYGRPPKVRQFAAGKSGNPRGRPKGSRNVGAVLAEVIRQSIAVTENGKTRRISALEVMLRRLANDAMRNDSRALKLLLALVDRYVETPEAEVHPDKVRAEDLSILAQYLRVPGTPVSDPGEDAQD